MDNVCALIQFRCHAGERWDNLFDLENEIDTFISNNAWSITAIQIYMCANVTRRSQVESVKKLLEYSALGLDDLELRVRHEQGGAIDPMHPIHTLAVGDYPNLSTLKVRGTFLHSSVWQSSGSLSRLAFHDASIYPRLSMSQFCNALGSLRSLKHLEVVRYTSAFDREETRAARRPVPLQHLQTLLVQDSPQWIRWLMDYIEVSKTTEVEFVLDYDASPEDASIIVELMALPTNDNPGRLEKVNALELNSSNALTLIGRCSLNKPLFKISLPTNEASRESLFITALYNLRLSLPPHQITSLNLVGQTLAIPQQIWSDVLQSFPELRTIRAQALLPEVGRYYDPLGMRTLLCALEGAMLPEERTAVCPQLEKLEITGIPVSEAWIDAVIKSAYAREDVAMLGEIHLGMVLAPSDYGSPQLFSPQEAALAKLAGSSLKTYCTVKIDEGPY